MRRARSGTGSTCGALGRAGCFSFFSNKNLPVGEGGMIVTDDDELAAQHPTAALARDDDADLGAPPRPRSSYDVVAQGFNYRLDELRAAIGLVQLSRLPAENAARAKIAARYREALDGVEGITMPFARSTTERPRRIIWPSSLLPEGTRRRGPRGAGRAAHPDERPLPADPPLLAVQGDRFQAAVTPHGSGRREDPDLAALRAHA